MFPAGVQLNLYLIIAFYLAVNLYNLSVSVIYLANHRSLRRRSLLQHREPDRFWTLCFRVFPIQRSLNCLHLRQIRCNQSIAQQYCRWWSRDRRDKNRTSSSPNDLRFHLFLEFFSCRHFESKSRQTMKFKKRCWLAFCIWFDRIPPGRIQQQVEDLLRPLF